MAKRICKRKHNRLIKYLALSIYHDLPATLYLKSSIDMANVGVEKNIFQKLPSIFLSNGTEGLRFGLTDYAKELIENNLLNEVLPNE